METIRDVRDLDLILLQGISPVQALRESPGTFRFPLYVRNSTGGLSPKEAEIIFSYNGSGLNLDIFVDDEKVNSSSLQLDNAGIADLLIRRSLSLKNTLLPDTSGKLKLESVNGLNVNPGRINFDTSNLEYLGNGVFLPLDILQMAGDFRNSVKAAESAAIRIDLGQVNPGLNYYPIFLDDNEAVKAAKFFANLEREGLYRDGKLVFKSKNYNLNELLDREEAVESVGHTSAELSSREREFREFTGLEKSRGDFHPAVVLYALRIPNGRYLTNPIDALKSLFLDMSGLEKMIASGMVERKTGIVKSSLMKSQAQFYYKVWQLLIKRDYKVPAAGDILGNVSETVITKADKILKIDYNARLIGREFSSAAVKERSGSKYLMPAIIPGKFMPKSTNIRLHKTGDRLVAYTESGFAGEFNLDEEFKFGEKLIVKYEVGDAGINVIGVESAAEELDEAADIELPTARDSESAKAARAPGIEAESETRTTSEITRSNEGIGRIQDIRSRHDVPLVSKLPILNPMSEKRIETSAVKVEKTKPETSALETRINDGLEKIRGKDKISMRVGIAPSEFHKHRDGLVAAGLIHKDPADDSWYTNPKSIDRIREKLGVTSVKVNVQPSQNEVRPGYTKYNMNLHIPLKVIVFEIIASSYKGNDDPFKQVFGRAANGPLKQKLLKEEDKKGTLLFVKKEDAKAFAELFIGDDKFNMSKTTVDGIAGLYTLDSMPFSEARKERSVNLEDVLTDNGRIRPHSEEFFDYKYRLAKDCRELLFLFDGKHPVVRRSDTGQINMKIAEYLRSNEKDDGKPDNPNDTFNEKDAAYLKITEQLITEGKVTQRTSRREFVSLLELYALEKNRAHTLYPFALTIAEIKRREGTTSLQLDAAVEVLQRHLGHDETKAWDVLQKGFKIEGVTMSRAELMTYVARERFISGDERPLYT